ncbi:MAG: SDR family oxidoreductase [Myxococcota bacterium]|nr:SDR family NAD(P)-dependent oxidoreductase [Deltaproteobacteria bacterium]MDQ3338398.1 SDR family oxidoreductase [Myxococcota bacterium]
MRERVVVLTGASSGLGRAAAIELAGRGAWLVLAARRREALEDVARECLALGGRAIVVPTDVTKEAEVDRLAQAALVEWGRIDVWVNNAGVTLYALLEEGPVEPHQRVIETNLYGSIYGARAAVPIFRRQGRGTLINVGSVLSGVGQAFVPSYVISKFGVHGLSEALRVELADEPDIHVCTLFPYAIDTQHFQVAANELQRAPYALPPVQSPEHVARALADLAEHPRRTRYVPRSAALGLALHAIAPSLTERLLLDALRRWHISDEPQHTGTGNLYAPATELAKVHGDRRPLLRMPTFVAWLLWRFARIELAALRRFLWPRHA